MEISKSKKMLQTSGCLEMQHASLPSVPFDLHINDSYITNLVTVLSDMEKLFCYYLEITVYLITNWGKLNWTFLKYVCTKVALWLKCLIPHPSKCYMSVWVNIMVIDGFDGGHYTCCGQHMLFHCSWTSPGLQVKKKSLKDKQVLI